MSTATDLARDLAKERGEFQHWYKSQTNEEGSFTGDGKEFRKRNDAIGELATKYEGVLATETAIKANEDGMAALSIPNERKVRGGDMSPTMGDALSPDKTLGERFTESKQFTDFTGGPRSAGSTSPFMTLDVDRIYGKRRGFDALTKTILDTATSWNIQNIRLPEVLTPGAQQPTVASLMPEGRTSGNAILYMEETTTTSNAAETAESGTKPEAAMVFTQRTSTVRKIAVSLPVTDESLEDIPFIESYIDTRLSFFIRQREDLQLLVGDGAGSNLRGLLNVSGINTQAAGADNNQDAILKGIVKLQVASFFAADAVVMHPNNWQTMRLAKDDVGNYLFGPPNLTGAEQVFGYRIVKTTAMTANTALAGAFRACAEVFRRSDLSLQVGWINDQFTKNQRTILVEERLALVPFRPSGFTAITGLS